MRIDSKRSYLDPGLIKGSVIVILTLLTALLWAQPVELPDVRVSAESSIQSYLYKKTMRFGGEVSAYDTLPTFVPRLRQVPLRSPLYQKAQPLDAFMTFRADTDSALDAYLSYYPREEHFRRVSVNYSPRIRNKGVRRQYFELTADMPFSSHLFSPEIRHNYHSDQTVKAYHSIFGLRYHYPSLSFGTTSIVEPHINLAYYDLLQVIGDIEASTPSYILDVRADLGVMGHKGSMDFRHKREHSGFRLSYNLPQQAIPLEDVKLGLITDFHGLAPALEFRYRPIIGQNQYLELYHQSSFSNADSFELLERYIQVAQVPTYRIAYRPMDLRLRYDRLFPDKQDLKHLLIEAAASYTINAELLEYDSATGLCMQVSEDLYQNNVGVKLFWEADDAKMVQSVKLNLDYVPTNSYRRRTYSPLLELDSVLSITSNKLDYYFTLEQNYNRLNYMYQSLPEDIDLSLTLSYPISEQYRLYGGIKRIFGSKARDCEGLRMQGRELWAELRVFL